MSPQCFKAIPQKISPASTEKFCIKNYNSLWSLLFTSVEFKYERKKLSQEWVNSGSVKKFFHFSTSLHQAREKTKQIERWTESEKFVCINQGINQASTSTAKISYTQIGLNVSHSSHPLRATKNKLEAASFIKSRQRRRKRKWNENHENKSVPRESMMGWNGNFVTFVKKFNFF